MVLDVFYRQYFSLLVVAWAEIQERRDCKSKLDGGLDRGFCIFLRLKTFWHSHVLLFLFSVSCHLIKCKLDNKNFKIKIYLSMSNYACLINERIHVAFIVIYSMGQDGEDKVVLLR